LMPESASVWDVLAELAQEQGDTGKEHRARERAEALRSAAHSGAAH